MPFYPCRGGGRYKIVAVVGFVGANPDNVPSHQGNTLYGTLTVIVSNGVIESRSWILTHADNLGGDNMYYQSAKIWNITIEKI